MQYRVQPMALLFIVPIAGRLVRVLYPCLLLDRGLGYPPPTWILMSQLLEYFRLPHRQQWLAGMLLLRVVQL